MKQEFDMVKALHTLTYDLESQSGQYNMGKMYTALLDRCAKEAVKSFHRLAINNDYLRAKKTKGSYIRDEWARIDSDQRLFKRFRKMCKEYYAYFFDALLNSTIDWDMDYDIYFSSYDVGGRLAGDFIDELLNNRWKR